MLYSFILEQDVIYNKKPSHISVIGVLKPLSIGNINFILKCAPILLQKKINIQLQRIIDLMNDISNQISNPKYQKVQQNNQIELKIVKEAYIIHKNYFTKLMYLKGKGMLKNNMLTLSRLQTQYNRQIFMLSQQYKKTKLEMQNISLSNDNTLST